MILSSYGGAVSINHSPTKLRNMEYSINIRSCAFYLGYHRITINCRERFARKTFSTPAPLQFHFQLFQFLPTNLGMLPTLIDAQPRVRNEGIRTGQRD
jgi:hypothetical protein